MSEVLELYRTTLESDYQQCAALFANSDPWRALGQSLAYNYHKVSSPDEEVFVIKTADKVIACLLLEMHSTLKAFIRGLVVAEGYRNRNLGAALVAFAEKRAFYDCANVFTFCSTENGKRFWQSNGYQIIGEITDMNVTGVAESILRKTQGPAQEIKFDKMEILVFDSEAATYEAALLNAGRQLFSLGLVSSEYGLKCIEREKEFPTGLPLEIPLAIARTDTKYSYKNSLCFQRLKTAVMVREMAGNSELPCQLIINLAIANPDDQVKVLEKLLAHLQETEFVKQCLYQEAEASQQYLKEKLLSLVED